MRSKAAIIINFPVKPHVFKYLQSKVGKKLTVTSTTFFGSVVLDILSKRHYDLALVNSDLDFPVEISLRYMEKQGFYINDRVVRKFNARMDDMFREEMFSFVDINFTQNSIPMDKSIRTFTESFGITEDDIKFETLKKYFHREKNTEEGQN